MRGNVLLLSALTIPISGSDVVPVVKFGIVTDVHYADAPASGTRHYRDSLPKMKDALRDINAEEAGFLIELGDFKDTDASHHCTDKAEPTEFCLNVTEGFLREMEHTIEKGFAGPRYHVLGNHDVDILTQAQAVAVEHNTDDTVHPLISGNVSEGYFSFNAPALNTVAAPLRFLVLNGDFTDRDLPWDDLDGPGASASGMSWDKANVPTAQLSWLASQLSEASGEGQHVVVFVHYRLDGGLQQPGETPPSTQIGLRDWIDSCTLQNAASVRAVLEAEPGLVLATFSGHDHIPKPPYTHTKGKPAYITLFGMIEGAHAEDRNAYSVVSILSDCSVFVRGWADQPNITIEGPSDCNLGSFVV